MGLFDRFRRQTGVKSGVSFGGGRGYTGGDSFVRESDPSGRAYTLPYLQVREHDARNSSIVASVAGWAMRNVVQVEPGVRQMASDGTWETIPGHDAWQIVRYPQKLIVSEDRAAINYRRMLRALVWSLIFDGNAYLLKVRNPGGRVIGLDWVPHSVVTIVERDGNPSIIERYEVRRRSGIQRVDKRDMVHVTMGIDPDHPAAGCSALKSVMRLVMTDNQIGVFSHAVLRNPFPGLVLTPEDGDSMQAQDLALLIDQVMAASSGERGGGVVAFTQPLKAQTLGYSPDDMAVRELARLPEERITGVFGIPAIVCGMGAGLERSTFANFEQAREAAIEEFMVPLWDDIAEAFTEQLLPEFDKSGLQQFVLDYSQVKALQEDADSMHARVREDFKANLIDRARAKQMLGEQPGPEDEGVYAYQLRPAPPMVGDTEGAKTRAEAERAI